MASDSSPSQEGKKRKKKSDRAVKCKDNGAGIATVHVDIDELTASGHSALQGGNCEEALSCFKKAFKASIELKETRVQRVCAFNLGAAYVEAGKPQKGLEFLTRAQPGERGERVADLQFNLGVARDVLGELGQATGHYLQAAQLYRSQGDGASEGDTCMKMARCHFLLQEWSLAASSYQRAGESYRVAGKLDTAAMALKEAGSHMLRSDDFTMDDIINVLTECLELSEDIKDPESLGDLYNDLGLSFSQLKLFQEAASCYERALPLAGIGAKPSRLAVVLQNLGAAHNSLGKYRQALEYHTQAASLHGSQGSRRSQGRCFSNLGFALSQLGQHEEAAENYLHALQAFKDTDDYKGQCQAYEGLGEARLKLRDLKKATQYYKKALGALSQCKDSSSSVQERLVNKLSDTLQLTLSLTTPGRLQRGPGPHRHSHNGILPGQAARLPDIKGTKPGPGLQTLDPESTQHHRGGLSNGHRVEGGLQMSGAGSVAGSSQEQVGGVEALGQEGDQTQRETTGEEAGHVSPLRGVTPEQSGHVNVLPGANRNLNNTYEHPDPHYQNQSISGSIGNTQQSDHLYESIKTGKTQMNSEIPLVEDQEAPPTSGSVNEDATALIKKWKSRICTVM
ncbi:tetratricopeptide repeat protein 24 [Osmerus mordax]|uniref:tetratricopeptide repeat protein 24 n=1 Tax=Osmerus mordax TaxID=8014 RepID=UPI00350EC4F6